MVRRILCFFVFVLIAGSVSAVGSSIEIDYLPQSIETIETAYSTFVLRVNTAFNGVCRYSAVEPANYSSMPNQFSETGSSIHRENFIGLAEGYHRYFIKCRNYDSGNSSEPEILEVVFNVNSLISADLILSHKSPIGVGRIDLDLKTSKIPSGVPTLEYSLNSQEYKMIPLTGSLNSWRGYLIIDSSAKESILSFRFGATDLYGRKGNLITSESVYYVDTLPPGPVRDVRIESTGRNIELDWEDVNGADSYIIYRSVTSDVGLKDEYRTVEKSEFTDTGVDYGKLYYYAIAAMDAAGNVGSLSSIVECRTDTALPTTKTMLNSKLTAQVNQFLQELSYVKDQLNSANNNLKKKGDKEKYFIQTLKLENEISVLERDFSNIEAGAQSLKEQDLSEEVFKSKIEQLYARMRVAEKNIPTDLIILDSVSGPNELNDQIIGNAVEAKNTFLSESEYRKAVKDSKRIAEEKSLSISSTITKIRVDYSGGLKKEIVFVERNYDSLLEKMDGGYLVENFPTALESQFDKVKVVNMNYDLAADRKAIYFPTDVKKAAYYFEADVFDEVGNIIPSFVYLNSDSGTIRPVGISGFTIFSGEGANQPLITISVLFAILLGAYLLLVYRRKKREIPPAVKDRLLLIDELVWKREYAQAKKEYGLLKKEYGELKPSEKERVYREIVGLRNKLIVAEFEKNLEKYKSEPSPELLSKIEKLFEELPPDMKGKLSETFKKVRWGR